MTTEQNNNLKEFVFNTGVRPFDQTPPAGMAFMKGFRDSGNGTYVIPFYCENVPEKAVFMYASNHFENDTSKTICRHIHNSALNSKYAHFLIGG